MDFKESTIDLLQELGYDNLEGISDKELSELILRHDITYLDILGYSEFDKDNYSSYANHEVLYNKGA